MRTRSRRRVRPIRLDDGYGACQGLKSSWPRGWGLAREWAGLTGWDPSAALGPRGGRCALLAVWNSRLLSAGSLCPHPFSAGRRFSFSFALAWRLSEQDTDYKAVPLKIGEGEEYMLALKQELRETMKRMPYFIETQEEKQDIERYSKRYMKVYKEEWIPDFALPSAGPKELEKKDDGEKSDEENEEKEGSKDKSKEGDEDEDEDAEEQEEYDEEEQEEENDYINSYFDNGDDFGADSDDNMDEATY
ncbi:DNA-directed RNA polymerase III subunit RPC7 [Tupaia chinensis]|uniref:DNA-directed RNA polymerase III subunit RPC7 n=1 Tax=Tupaia chinensis TaxID=246437 RepID=L9JPY8_TUPCH|nr:DNA-directed RNA polymerase III subunit RPC7 [Tupaia chinensis]